MARRKFEGYWTCTHCGKKGIGGLTKTCPNCGNPQAEGLKFYMADDSKRYLEPEIAKDYGKGADWVCDYCGGYNRYNRTICKNCGSAKIESSHDYFGKAINQEPIDVFEHNSSVNATNKAMSYREISQNAISQQEVSHNAISQEFSQQQETFQQPTIDETECSLPLCYEKSNSFNKVKSLLKNVNLKLIFSILGGAVGVISLIFILILIFTPKTYTAQISDKSWSRSISIEELRTIDENGWDVPFGGRVYDEKQEIRDYDKVIDHYDVVENKVPRKELDHYDYNYYDNGDGTFDEEEIPVYNIVYDIEYEKVAVYKKVPIYDTKYYYKIDRWYYDRTEISSGKTDNPYWPELNLGDKEKESSKSETYTIYFETQEKDSYSKNVSYKDWEKFSLGEEYRITVVAGVVTEIVPLLDK